MWRTRECGATDRTGVLRLTVLVCRRQERVEGAAERLRAGHARPGQPPRADTRPPQHQGWQMATHRPLSGQAESCSSPAQPRRPANALLLSFHPCKIGLLSHDKRWSISELGDCCSDRNRHGQCANESCPLRRAVFCQDWTGSVRMSVEQRVQSDSGMWRRCWWCMGRLTRWCLCGTAGGWRPRCRARSLKSSSAAGTCPWRSAPIASPTPSHALCPASEPLCRPTLFCFVSQVLRDRFGGIWVFPAGGRFWAGLVLLPDATVQRCRGLSCCPAEKGMWKIQHTLSAILALGQFEGEPPGAGACPSIGCHQHDRNGCAIVTKGIFDCVAAGVFRRPQWTGQP